MALKKINNDLWEDIKSNGRYKLYREEERPEGFNNHGPIGTFTLCFFHEDIADGELAEILGKGIKKMKKANKMILRHYQIYGNKKYNESPHSM